MSGVGALAFGVLLFVAMILANPPGGSFSAHDAAKYVEKGHRPLVIVSIYLAIAAASGLLALLARLREAIASPRVAQAFWGLGVASVAGFVVGWALVASLPIALAYGGHGVSSTPQLTFILAECGWVLMYGAGGILLGVALIVFAATRVEAPAWFRWSTLVAGIAALAAPAWFPFFLVMIWAVVAGIWLLVAGREPAPSLQPRSA